MHISSRSCVQISIMKMRKVPVFSVVLIIQNSNSISIQRKYGTTVGDSQISEYRVQMNSEPTHSDRRKIASISFETRKVFFCPFPDFLYTRDMSLSHQPTGQPSHYFAFTLGREWKLSLAELFAVWGEENYREHSETIAIFQIYGYSDEQIQKRFLTIGGSIRVMKIVGETDPKRFPTDVI